MRYFGEDVPGVSQVRIRDSIVFSPNSYFLLSEFLRRSDLQLPG